VFRLNPLKDKKQKYQVEESEEYLLLSVKEKKIWIPKSFLPERKRKQAKRSII
jgi:hypothetical protein